MGVYLSQPITDKVSNDYESAWLKCGVSSMQGWRSSQEDAHNCVLEYDKDTSFFAVYDGHGGHEVAEYTARNLPDFLKKIEAYKGGDFEKALVDAFIDFDATLTEETVIAKLKAIAMENSDDQGPGKDEDEVDVAELKEEANMPLTELIAKYASGGGKNPALRRVSGDSSSQPASPYLKAKPGKQEGAGCSKDSAEEGSAAVNGAVETNGDTNEDKEPKSSGGGSSDKDAADGQASSSAVNGEHADEKTPESGDKKDEKEEDGGSPDDEEKKRIKSAIRIAKKKATVTMLAQLFEDNHSDSDSDNDESFHAKDGANEDDEEDEDEEGEAEEDEEEEGDEEGEEEEESDEDDSAQFCEEDSAGTESGCAAVVALLHKSKLYVANAGDSRAVLSRQGKAVDLSIDHKPDDPLERQRIQKAGGNVTHDGRVNGGLNLSRALGDHYYKKCPDVDAKSQMITALPDIQIAEVDPARDEFLVLACDGIWNSMSSQEVVDFVKPLIEDGYKLSAICEKLFDKCLAPDTMGDGTGCDNMTCIIVTFSSDGSANGSPDSCKRSASPLPQEDSNKRPKVESPST